MWEISWLIKSPTMQNVENKFLKYKHENIEEGGGFDLNVFSKNSNNNNKKKTALA